MQTNLILVRHGQSIWNQENLFTGWVDIDLSAQGVEEAHRAGQGLAELGIKVDVAFTSVLKRAIRTLSICLDELDQMWVPVTKAWQLNERHYGALQGLNKAATAQKYGEEQVLIWRRSYSVLPPLLASDDAMHPCHDRRYAAIPADQLPAAESLQTTLNRVVPYWQQQIVPCLQAGKTVLVAAHGNSLRALLKHLNGISEAEVLELNIPTGLPLLMQIDQDLQVQAQQYLGGDEAARIAAQAVANQGKAG